jgi:hypothetical protein
MEPEAIGDVLAVAAAFDNRTVGVADNAAWFKVIGHLNQAEVEDAIIAHYAETTDRIMPAHVLTRVGKIRALRLAHAGPEAVPDADPDDVPAYQAALREGRWRTANGAAPRPVRRAIETAFNNGKHLRVESKWDRSAPITHRRFALPAAPEPEAPAIDPDYVAAEAVLAQLPDRAQWIRAARAELEAEGVRLTRAAEAIRAADLATRTSTDQGA